jgi:hypothetical protein
MIRVGVFAGLAHAILIFGLSFVQVFLISWLVDVLAPTFGGQRDSLAALKVTAYSFTPGWVAAVLNIIPMLGLLGILAALYGLYLLYLGLPVLMRCPKEKSVGYTVVLVICAVVLSVVVTTLSTCVIAGMGVVGMGALSRGSAVTDAVTGKADSAAVLANVFGAKTDAERERVTQAMNSLEKMGAADKANPQAAAANAQPNLYDAIDSYSKQRKIAYIHLRNVVGKVPNYRETFIDEGDVDMLRILSILAKNEFDGVVIPDHTPQMTCSAPWHAGMAHTIGFILAAQAMFKSSGGQP